MIIFVILIVAYLGCFAKSQGRGPGPRNLVLTEQELKFAGTALRAALTSNSNSYVSIWILVIFNAASMKATTVYKSKIRDVIVSS